MRPTSDEVFEHNAASHCSWCLHVAIESAITALAAAVVSETHHLPISTQGTGVTIATCHRSVCSRPAVADQYRHRLVFFAARAKLVSARVSCDER